MLSSIYIKAYFISNYSLSSILIRNPCFYNKIKKGGSSERKKKKQSGRSKSLESRKVLWVVKNNWLSLLNNLRQRVYESS